MEDLSKINVSYLLLLSAFVVPGAVSIFVFKLLVPSVERPLKDGVVEAIVSGIINFVILFWPILYAIDPNTLSNNPIHSWLIIIACLFIAPAVWPLILVKGLSMLGRRGLVMTSSKTAWDRFFEQAKSGCWVIVHLTNGERIGGRFSVSSYASAFPREGHIYIQELWELDQGGRFLRELDGPQGVVLRPSDYHYLRVFRPDHDWK